MTLNQNQSVSTIKPFPTHPNTLYHDQPDDLPQPLNARLMKVADAIQCPKCKHSQITIHQNQCFCNHCQTSYAIVNQVPILMTSSSDKILSDVLNADTAKLMNDDYQQKKQQASNPEPTNWLKQLIQVIRPPEIMYHYNPTLAKDENTWSLFTHAGTDTQVLNVGGGPFRYSNQEITLNIRPFHHVDCVGDAHHIPFEDNTFDSVICNAVLEHVHSPEAITKEMIRVLKPGGKLYAEIPFIFFFHGFPSDYRRYTLEGMKYLFTGLEHRSFGMTHGPVSALLQSANTLMQICIPKQNSILTKIANGVFRWVFFPFKYLDILLKNNPKAHFLAGGFWVHGTKPSADT